jgi:formate hydrogenlyase subunit 6/NADH:ubiquinone oxidoreductase subunit I
MDACPRKAIIRGPEYELAATSREGLIYDMDRLKPETVEEVEEE